MIKIPTEANIKTSGYAWIYKIIVLALFISIAFSLISTGILPILPIWAEVLILAVFIVINIVFDTIGTAVAAASQVPFHSMNSRNVKGTKHALSLIRNGEKVSNFCNDVIGDICGVVSGGATAILIENIVRLYNLNLMLVSLALTSIVAILIITGKALGKTVALKHSNQIVYQVALVMRAFKREK